MADDATTELEGGAAVATTATTSSATGTSSLSSSGAGGDADYPVDRKKATMILSLSAEQRYALYLKWEPYDVESWYTALARYTFPSVFVPLSAGTRSRTRFCTMYHAPRTNVSRSRQTLLDASSRPAAT